MTSITGTKALATDTPLTPELVMPASVPVAKGPPIDSVQNALVVPPREQSRANVLGL